MLLVQIVIPRLALKLAVNSQQLLVPIQMFSLNQ